MKQRFACAALLLAILLQACTFGPRNSTPPLDGEAETTPIPIPATPTLGAPEPLNIPPLGLPAPAPDPWVEAQIGKMSLREKLGQLLVIGVSGSELTPETCLSLQQVRPAGVFYQAENLASPAQARQLSAGLQECASQVGLPPLLIALDHEGQGDTYFQSGATIFPPALGLSATGNPQSASRAARASGQEVAFSGVNLILGPVADVITNPDIRLMSMRTFGSDPSAVQAFVVAAMQAYQEVGLIPVVKHFPGHGGADARYAAHLYPIDMSGASAVEKAYLPPFLAAMQAGAPVVMVSHVAFPRLTGSYQPASLAPEMMKILREQIGYRGVLISDAIMVREGITTDTFGVPAAALAALSAGLDLALLPEPEQVAPTLNVLEKAVTDGELSEQRVDDSLRRVLTLKAAHNLQAFPVQQPPEPDWQANAALASELGGKGVTVYQDEHQLLPLPSSVRKVLVIGPDPQWGFYPKLEGALKERGIESKLFLYSPPWDGVIKERTWLQTLPDEMQKYDLTLFFTWQAHLSGLAKDAWQSKLGKRIAKDGSPAVIIALQSPTDLLDFPKIGTFVTTFGTTDGQMQAVIEALIGVRTPTGKNPVPGLVPSALTGGG